MLSTFDLDQLVLDLIKDIKNNKYIDIIKNKKNDEDDGGKIDTNKLKFYKRIGEADLYIDDNGEIYIFINGMRINLKQYLKNKRSSQNKKLSFFSKIKQFFTTKGKVKEILNNINIFKQKTKKLSKLDQRIKKNLQQDNTKNKNKNIKYKNINDFTKSLDKNNKILVSSKLSLLKNTKQSQDRQLKNILTKVASSRRVNNEITINKANKVLNDLEKEKEVKTNEAIKTNDKEKENKEITKSNEIKNENKTKEVGNNKEKVNNQQKQQEQTKKQDQKNKNDKQNQKQTLTQEQKREKIFGKCKEYITKVQREGRLTNSIMQQHRERNKGKNQYKESKKTDKTSFEQRRGTFALGGKTI